MADIDYLYPQEVSVISYSNYLYDMFQSYNWNLVDSDWYANNKEQLMIDDSVFNGVFTAIGDATDLNTYADNIIRLELPNYGYNIDTSDTKSCMTEVASLLRSKLNAYFSSGSNKKKEDGTIYRSWYQNIEDRDPVAHKLMKVVVSMFEDGLIEYSVGGASEEYNFQSLQDYNQWLLDCLHNAGLWTNVDNIGYPTLNNVWEQIKNFRYFHFFVFNTGSSDASKRYIPVVVYNNDKLSGEIVAKPYGYLAAYPTGVAFTLQKDDGTATPKYQQLYDSPPYTDLGDVNVWCSYLSATSERANDTNYDQFDYASGVLSSGTSVYHGHINKNHAVWGNRAVQARSVTIDTTNIISDPANASRLALSNFLYRSNSIDTSHFYANGGIRWISLNNEIVAGKSVGSKFDESINSKDISFDGTGYNLTSVNVSNHATGVISNDTYRGLTGLVPHAGTDVVGSNKQLLDLIDELKDLLKKYKTQTPDDVFASTLGANAMLTMYNPSSAEMLEIVRHFFTSTFATSLKDFVTSLRLDPMDAFVSLRAYPFHPQTGGSREMGIFGVGFGTYAPVISNQFQTFDFGTCKVDELYHSYLDYAPYTKVSIYLPFVGFVDLDPNEVIGSTITLKYRVELFTGNCVALIGVKRGSLDATLYQFTGSIGVDIPMSGVRFSQFASGAIQAVGGAISHNAMEMIGGVANATSVKTNRSGSMSGNAGMCGNFSPYIAVTHPITADTQNYGACVGRPANIMSTIGQLSGYNELDNFDLSGVSATSTEKQELEEILKNGFYV